MSDLVNDRAQQVLKSLIDLYIRDGQPVGSKALVEEANLPVSAATVRNVMADLEQHGLITSPHTSAGRVPTQTGYRLFVDNLISVQPLQGATLDQMKGLLSPETNSQHLIESASQLLSDVTAQAGLVTLPRREQTWLTQVEFLPLSDNRILVVLVVNDQEVQNRVIYTHRPYSREELQDAARVINETYAGRTLEEARENLLGSMASDREKMDALMRSVLEVAEQTFQSEEEGGYVVAGQTRLLDSAEPGNMMKIRDLFDAFNEKREILHLLDNCVRAEGVQIFIGQESGYDVLDDYSVITAPYQEGGQVVGVLGVIGPTRMAYDRVIPIVDATARMLSSALNSK